MEYILPAAADLLIGIPIGVPPAVNDAATKIIAEGGISGTLLILALAALAILAWIVVWWQPKQHRYALEKQQQEYEEDRDAWEGRHRSASCWCWS